MMCPALQWSFGLTQKSNPYFIMRKWIPVSHSPALSRARGLPYQEGQPCMAWVQGIWTSKHEANLDQPIGQKHLKPLAGTMGARQAMPAPLLPSLSQAERKKKNNQLRFSEVPAPTVSSDQQGHRPGVRTEQSLQSTNWWSEPSPVPFENY